MVPPMQHCRLTVLARRAGSLCVLPGVGGNCTFTASMVPAITHPDSFASAERRGRSLVDGRWGDTWVSNTAPWIHYNFSTTMDIVTGLPQRDCGPTMPSPPWAYACSRHHHVKSGLEYTSSEWEAFFDLDTSACHPKAAVAEAEILPTVWPHSLMQHAH